MSDLNWTQGEIAKVVEEISRRSMTDSEFRQRVLTDPNQVIKEVSGRPTPEGFRIDVVEPKPGVDWTFVLPPLLSDQMSDEELDYAAAGRGSASGSGAHTTRYPTL